MSAELWACSACGGPGVLNLGTRGYCSSHASELLRGFDPSVWSMNGRWVEIGCSRPDHGPGYAECECPACGATAVAVVGAPCGYCEWAVRKLSEWQADLVLAPPDVDPADAGYEAAMRAWADRIAVAVEAGIVDERSARAVWDRTVRRAA